MSPLLPHHQHCRHSHAAYLYCFVLYLDLDLVLHSSLSPLFPFPAPYPPLVALPAPPPQVFFPGLIFASPQDGRLTSRVFGRSARCRLSVVLPACVAIVVCAVVTRADPLTHTCTHTNTRTYANIHTRESTSKRTYKDGTEYIPTHEHTHKHTRASTTPSQDKIQDNFPCKVEELPSPAPEVSSGGPGPSVRLTRRLAIPARPRLAIASPPLGRICP